MTDKDDVWDKVAEAVSNAFGMYWDGCHKIYLAMDNGQMAIFAKYGYEFHKPNLDLLQQWFDDSCGLRFINAVHTVEGDPNKGYVDLIPQFYFEENDEENDDV